MEVSLKQLEHLNEDDRARALSALASLGRKVLYSSKLLEFFDTAYDWQKEYFNAIGNYNVVGLVAGNRVGKSEAAAAFTACAVMGIWPDWYTGYRFEDKGLRVYLCGSQSAQLREAMQVKLFGTEDRNQSDLIGTGFIPKDAILKWGAGRDGSMTNIWIQHQSGNKSRIEVFQYTQSDQSFQGGAIDFAVIDEEPGEKFFQQILKRVAVAPHNKKPGYVITAFTPEHQEEGHVMKQMWNLPMIHPAGSKRDDGTEYDYNVKCNDDLGWLCVNAGWPSVKHLDDQWMKSQLYGTPEYLHDTIMWGKPMLGGDLIYKVDIPRILYDPEDVNIMEHWPHLIGLDWGFTRDPAALVQLAWDEVNDVVYVIDCWKGQVDADRELAKKIWAIDATSPVAWPKDGNRSAAGFKGGATIAQRMMDVGANLLPEPFVQVDIHGKKNAELEPGFVEIRSRMHTGRFLINKDLVPLIEEMEEYKYDTNGKPKNRQEDHLLDAMRYGAISLIQGNGESLRDDARYDDEEEQEDVYWNTY